jgi:transketolase
MKATRDWFGEALIAAAETNDKVVVVNCDLASATRTQKFKFMFPDRFVECGIAEANAISIAAGLAQEGFRPFVASFAHFLTGKFLEIFQSVALNNAGVVLVGTHAGLAIGKDGPTQMGLRDLAVMRSLHNVRIMQPADGRETRQMLRYLTASTAPAYLRLCRQPTREVHTDDYAFAFGRVDVIRSGSGPVVFTMGGMVSVVLDAVELLPAAARPSVINVSSLPAAPADVLAALAGSSGHALVVEDHFAKGGLTDEIARILVGYPGVSSFDSVSVTDFGQSGDPDDLYERYCLDRAGLARRFLALATIGDIVHDRPPQDSGYQGSRRDEPAPVRVP